MNDIIIPVWFDKADLLEWKPKDFSATFDEMRGTLSELEEKLDEAFVRVGRSYLVNLHYVRRIGKTELILNTGEKLLVPRGSYKKLNEAFIKYF